MAKEKTGSGTEQAKAAKAKANSSTSRRREEVAPLRQGQGQDEDVQASKAMVNLLAAALRGETPGDDSDSDSAGGIIAPADSSKVMSKSDRIRKLKQQGMAVADIAKELGILYQHAYNVCLAADLIAVGVKEPRLPKQIREDIAREKAAAKEAKENV